jgi:hypothetical protein
VEKKLTDQYMKSTNVANMVGDGSVRPTTLQSKSSKSYKVEVLVDGKWATNAVRFATEVEAQAAGQELLSRWFVPVDSRAALATEPVNYRFDFQAFRPVRLAD